MIVAKKVRKEKDGSYTSVWNLSEDQISYLVTFAINVLLAKGVVEIEEIDYEDVLDKYDVKNASRN